MVNLHILSFLPTDHFFAADLKVNFSRSPVDECDLQCSDCEVVLEPWVRPILDHTTSIRARIGQSGGERGYAGITSMDVILLSVK